MAKYGRFDPRNKKKEQKSGKKVRSPQDAMNFINSLEKRTVEAIDKRETR
jgi:hypothetical protein|tara:strand:+ start:244 stop:393 length:150 start_codon:yes stop_codon:yes gene_type:complete